LLGVVEQLKRQVNDIEKNRAQTQQTLTNQENVLRNAQARQQTAETNLKTINVQLTNKQQSIREIEDSVATKQQQIEAKQAEHATKQRASQEAKNKVIIIDQDLSLANNSMMNNNN